MHTPVCRALLAASALLLSACASVSQQDCDPRNADAGFLTKFNCNNQGVYAQRVAYKQQVLLDERETNQQFRAVYAAIQKEQGEVSGELSRNKAEYASLNQALNNLLGNLKRRAQGNQRIQSQISAIEKDLSEVNRNQNGAAVMQKKYELQKLQSRVAELEGDLGLQK